MKKIDKAFIVSAVKRMPVRKPLYFSRSIEHDLILAGQDFGIQKTLLLAKFRISLKYEIRSESLKRFEGRGNDTE